MANINDVLRRTSGYVDSSGKYPPPAIQTQAIMSLGGGLYPVGQTAGGDASSSEENTLVGRISLGFIAAMVLGAVLFYFWTNEIQGGG